MAEDKDTEKDDLDFSQLRECNKQAIIMTYLINASQSRYCSPESLESKPE